MLFSDADVPRVREEIAPGAVWLPGWLTIPQQAWLARQCAQWAAGPVPIRSATVRGHPMSVKTVCVGWHWRPYAYSRDAVDVNGQRVVEFPKWMVRLGRRIVADATGDEDRALAYTPDTALINFYDVQARMGMHQDKDEKSLAPVVSLSIGDTCTFRFGNTENRNRPYRDIALASGDVFVFGGPSRLAFHGVQKIHAESAPDGCGVEHGRWNITMRETGFADSRPAPSPVVS
ncbi:alpha-ketoglutarate-dependent dioxygenase AlkB family protein [Jonesia denitrificans]|uniref:2OG-Fe(II) oxygenase n=1 Tax=Jonesia denitrificans (strain ATCC 14870 / DSM 20603 / BCRC 15368 / CIP 55.134 / JCM 11481 / NBRC 15587 / NCTC 10816 / Prevot 55134) TaxID=471856 RepID=C7QZR3_JONDD|nr:alpha-ketoglutarate-dependent dioxygenase AlkB [Jonesia denitrificans]ACV08069.1 2OG-Fe(II) oxygenase [Jonesia denitrificans DSM 20603]SQH20048.1 Alpha-ketoglutarate-dependent dioxygenase AlkB [Jonesia denitrificans]